MERKEPYYYYPAKLQMAWVYHYNEKRYGEDHAEQYIENLKCAIEEKQRSGEHKLLIESHQITIQTKVANIVKSEIYSFRWTEKPNQKRGYSIFYRKMSDGNIGVIGIFQDGADFPNRLLENIENIGAEIQRDKNKNL